MSKRNPWSIDSLVDDAEDWLHQGEQALGHAVEDVSHAAGEALKHVGLNAWGDALEHFGDKVGDLLGAAPDELQLGETHDPKQLVRGDAGALRDGGGKVSSYAQHFEQGGSGLKGISAGDFTGATADAFHQAMNAEVPKWFAAADACAKAAKAFGDMAAAVEWAQQQAAEAIRLWDEGHHKHDEWQKKADTYNDAVSRHNAGDDKVSIPPNPGPDPGPPLLEQARDTLKKGREHRDQVGNQVAGVWNEAAGEAPPLPPGGQRLLDTAADLGQAAETVNEHFAVGLVNGLSGLVKTVRTVNPDDPYNMTHPADYLRNVSAVAAGLTDAAAHPDVMVKGLIGTGWSKDPAQATGTLMSNLIPMGPPGAGVVADLAKVGLRSGLRDAVSSAMRGATKDAAGAAVKDGAGAAVKDGAGAAAKHSASPSVTDTGRSARPVDTGANHPGPSARASDTAPRPDAPAARPAETTAPKAESPARAGAPSGTRTAEPPAGADHPGAPTEHGEPAHHDTDSVAGHNSSLGHPDTPNHIADHANPDHQVPAAAERPTGPTHAGPTENASVPTHPTAPEGPGPSQSTAPGANAHSPAAPHTEPHPSEPAQPSAHSPQAPTSPAHDPSPGSHPNGMGDAHSTESPPHDPAGHGGSGDGHGGGADRGGVGTHGRPEEAGHHDPHPHDDASPSDHGVPHSDAGLTAEKRDEILAMEKGDRPDPSDYLSPEYIQSHMDKFHDGAARFMPESNLEKYGIAQRDGTSFVMPKTEADALIDATRGDPRALERALGLPDGFLDSRNVVRIDIARPQEFNLRIPSGNEAGANEQWIPGGVLPDGASEAVVDGGAIPKGRYTVTDAFE